MIYVRNPREYFNFIVTEERHAAGELSAIKPWDMMRRYRELVDVIESTNT